MLIRDKKEEDYNSYNSTCETKEELELYFLNDVKFEGDTYENKKIIEKMRETLERGQRYYTIARCIGKVDTENGDVFIFEFNNKYEKTNYKALKIEILSNLNGGENLIGKWFIEYKSYYYLEVDMSKVLEDLGNYDIENIICGEADINKNYEYNPLSSSESISEEIKYDILNEKSITDFKEREEKYEEEERINRENEEEKRRKEILSNVAIKNKWENESEYLDKDISFYVRGREVYYAYTHITLKENTNTYFTFEDIEGISVNRSGNINEFEEKLLAKKIPYEKKGTNTNGSYGDYENCEVIKGKIVNKIPNIVTFNYTKHYEIDYTSNGKITINKVIISPASKRNIILNRLSHKDGKMSKEDISLYLKLTQMEIDMVNLAKLEFYHYYYNKNNSVCLSFPIKVEAIENNNERQYLFTMFNKQKICSWEKLKEIFFNNGDTRCIQKRISSDNLIKLSELFEINKSDLFEYIKNLLMLKELENDGEEKQWA